jgi:hypothetical protein
VKVNNLFALLTLAAFVVEEIAHRRSRNTGGLPAEPGDEGQATSRMDFFDILRIVELLFLALILSTKQGTLTGTLGQTVLILVGLQASRIFARRVLGRWSVLGVLQGMEMLLLIVVMIPRTAPTPMLSQGPPWAEFLALTGFTAYGILAVLSAAFSVSYAVKYFAREGSGAYEEYPPLADSERWSARCSGKAFYAGLAGTLGWFLCTGASLLTLLLALSAILQGLGTRLSGKPVFSGHHPRAHLLWGVSFLLFLAVIAFGLSEFRIA